MVVAPLPGRDLRHIPAPLGKGRTLRTTSRRPTASASTITRLVLGDWPRSMSSAAETAAQPRSHPAASKDPGSDGRVAGSPLEAVAWA